MQKKRAKIKGILIVTITLAFSLLVWLNYAEILHNPVDELEHIVIRYYDFQTGNSYKEMTLTDQADLENIYNSLVNAEVDKVIRFSDAGSEPDPMWEITLKFEDDVEYFNNTYYGNDYGIRKYIKTGDSTGYVLLSSEDVYDAVEKVIAENVEMPENDIVAISRYRNSAWSYRDEGFFITSNGNVYAFNSSQHYGYWEEDLDEKFNQKLKMFIQHTEPFAVIETKDIRRLYSYILQVDCEETYETEPYAVDAGLEKLWFHNMSRDKMVLCRQTGDDIGELTSDAGKRLLHFWDKEILPMILDAEKVSNAYYQNYLYAEGDVRFYNSYYDGTGKAGNYIIQNEEDIQNLKTHTGVDLYDYEWDGIFPGENYVYLVEIGDASKMENGWKLNAILVKDGEVSFLRESKNKISEQGETDKEAKGGFCVITELSTWGINEKFNEDTERYELAGWDKP